MTSALPALADLDEVDVINKVPLLVSPWAGVLVLAACMPVATPAPASSIQDIIWQWQSVTNQTTREIRSRKLLSGLDEQDPERDDPLWAARE